MSIMELLRQAMALSVQTRQNLSDSASQVSQLKENQRKLYQLAIQFQAASPKKKEGVT